MWLGFAVVEYTCICSEISVIPLMALQELFLNNCFVGLQKQTCQRTDGASYETIHPLPKNEHRGQNVD